MSANGGLGIHGRASWAFEFAYADRLSHTMSLEICDHPAISTSALAHDFAIRRLFACARVTIAANIGHNCCQIWSAGRKVGGARPCLLIGLRQVGATSCCRAYC
jgi:hypothetical protein